MAWRWTWFRSRITAVLVSSLVWLLSASLTPWIVVGLGCVAVLAVACWRIRWMLWLRYGARRANAPIAEAIWPALIPVEWFRGRRQPRLWISTRPCLGIVAPDPQQLVVGGDVAHQHAAQLVTDEQVRLAAIRALAVADINRSRMVASVTVFCLPWSVLAGIVTSLRLRVTSRLTRFAWQIRWLFIVAALVELWQQQHWPGLIVLTLTAIATVTTPRWSTAWAHHRAAMVDQLAELHDKRGNSTEGLGFPLSDSARLVGGRR